MNWKTITDWIKKKWGEFIASLKTPVTPIPPVVVADPPVTPGPVDGIDITTIGSVLVVADMDLIPTRMRKAGFEGRDGALYYALAIIYMGGDSCATANDGETALLFQRRDEIYKWWDGELEKVSVLMRRNRYLIAKVIENDGKPTGAERLGCRLVGPTMARLAEFGDRVQPGDVFPEEGYA